MGEITDQNWQRRFEEEFSHDGVVGGAVLPSVMEQEQICGSAFIHKFQGHRVLADGFLDFFAITLRGSEDCYSKKGWPAYPWYPVFLIELIAQFRNMRASEVLALNGYPLDAYALQRNQIDQALYLGAVVKGTSSLSALYGLTTPPTSAPWTEDDQNRVFRHRLTEEKKILDQMIGKGSELGDDHQAAFTQWDRLFNLQVHGARLTTMKEAMTWLQKKEPFAVGPRLDDDTNALYMNRFTEVGWMMLRVLPFLQTDILVFNDGWQRKWALLDAVFRLFVNGLAGLGKKIALAFTAMIEAKFDTSPDTGYVER
jgi:hypothetical protein